MVGPSHHSGRCYNMWLCHGGVRRFEALMAGTSPEKGGRSHGSKIGAPKKAGRCLQHPWPAPATGHVAWHGVACCAVPCMAAVLVSSDCCEDGACQLHACWYGACFRTLHVCCVCWMACCPSELACLAWVRCCMLGSWDGYNACQALHHARCTTAPCAGTRRRLRSGVLVDPGPASQHVGIINTAMAYE